MDYRLWDCAPLVFTNSVNDMVHTHRHSHKTLRWAHCCCVCVCKISRPCGSNGCVSWVFRFVTVLSCCAKPLCGDNGRRGAKWGDKFRMRGSDEAFCRPPVGPQSCTASDGCIYCRPTSTASLITRIDKLALPHLLTTYKKRQKTPQWQLWDDTYAPLLLSLLLSFCFSPQITFFQGLNTVWAPLPFCRCFFVSIRCFKNKKFFLYAYMFIIIVYVVYVVITVTY